MSRLKCKKNVIDRFSAKESFKIMVLLSSEEGKLVPAEKIFFRRFQVTFYCHRDDPFTYQLVVD